MIRPRRTLVVATLALLTAGCGAPASEDASAPAPAGPTVDAGGLGFRVGPLPAGATVAANDAERLALGLELDGVQGTGVFTVRDEEGVNFVEEMKAFGRWAEEQPGGRFFGGNELVTQLGTAYTARVRVDDGATEERRVFVFHPDASDRLLTLTVRYPAGDDDRTRAWMRLSLEIVAGVRAPEQGTPA